MDDGQKSIFTWVGRLLIGVPLALFLWESQVDRFAKGAVSSHTRRGDLALADGRYLEAISAYGHARELAPTDPETQRNMMRARAYLAAEQPMRITSETLDELRYEAQYLLDVDHARADVYHAVLGNIASRSGNGDEARANFDAALKANPSSIVAHAANGIFLINQKDGQEKARAEFESVLKARPRHMVALVGLARLALNDKKPEQAVENLEKALAVQDDYTARMLLGDAKVQLQKMDDAVLAYQHATALDPHNADAMRSLGQALLAVNKPEEAERMLRAASQVQQDLQTVLALGFALERQHKSDQALSAFNTVLQQSGNDVPALFGLGSTLEDLDKQDEARKVYKRLISLQTAKGSTAATIQQQAQQRVAAIDKKAGAPEAAAPAPH